MSASIPMERLKPFVEALCDLSQSDVEPVSSADPWSCPSCFGVLNNPICIPCGHTYCQKCLEKDPDGVCKKCGVRWRWRETKLKDLHVTVLINNLCQKYWSNELNAIDLRNKGNKLFQSGSVERALEVYDRAFQLAPSDHLLLGNRSHAHIKLGNAEAALADAELAIEVKPDWAKGYFRKAIALQQLGRHSEAFQAFYNCLALERSNTKPVKNELTKILFHLMSMKRSNETEHIGDKARIPSDRLSVSEPNIFDNFESNEESQLVATERKQSTSNRNVVSNTYRLLRLLDDVIESSELLHASGWKMSDRDIDPKMVDPSDYDCPLCLRLLWFPVSTPCGHTFCKKCLDRCLDHNTQCPMCKASLTDYLANRKEAVNVFVEESIKRMMPKDYVDRQKIHDQEMDELAGAGKDLQHEIPVFVCTVSFPSIPCPLHVFEPRYRLMIRRCMESGTREFGMCGVLEPNSPFAEYGTMLEIRDIHYFPDGRSAVDTVGGRRFRVKSRGMRDGYHTASVEFITDLVPEGEELEQIQKLHNETLLQAKEWFNGMAPQIKEGILAHYGPLPDPENNYWTLENGPSWAWWIMAILPLDPQAQLQILSHTTLKKRLEAIQRIVTYISRKSK